MNFRDSIWMSLHNLWSRKGRTALNLFGIVISCVLLFLTFAGTRGAREGVYDIMNASDQTKRFMIFESYDRSAKVPAKVKNVPAGISEDRRSRLTEQLEDAWRSKNAKRIYLNKNNMQQLRSKEHVSSVVWQNPVRCSFVWPKTGQSLEAGDAQTPKPAPGSLIGIDPSSPRSVDRLVMGELVSEDDDQGVMVDEIAAFNLGFKTDEDLEKLIGVEVEIRCPLGKVAASPVSGLLGLGEILPPQMIRSLRRVTEQLDRTDLSDAEKKSIRKAMESLTDSGSKRQTSSPKNTAGANVDARGNKTLVRTGVVRGILKQPEDDDLFGFLKFARSERRANLYVHHRITEEMFSQRKGFKGYAAVAGSVSDVTHLRGAIREIESLGFRTHSAAGMVEKLEREINKVRLAAGALALVILLVAAIGICNTMIIAVLERTAEFGILKSVGAEDRQILRLVLQEGLITGAIGAAIAMAVSLGVAYLFSEIARAWIEEQLHGRFDQPVFLFHPIDGIIVFATAITMCVLASLLPARRAAKLNPIAAMKRK